MELFLQFGYGMKTLAIDLSKKWNGASVILSPRDMSPKQLDNWSQEFEKAGAKCYFDPQCYCPQSNDVKRLNEYTYWDVHLNTKLQSYDSSIDWKIKEIKKYNDISNTMAYILPCILKPFDEKWTERFLHQSKLFIEAAHKYMPEKPIYATLVFPKELLVQSEEVIEEILQLILEFDVDGYYIIAEAIDKKYLIDSPIWLSNVLNICAILKLADKKVIYGYGNHQLLPLSLVKVNAMASGTWQNVRSFTNRFIDVDEQKRKSTWVYYPEALSEYKMAFIDWAYTMGYLSSMKSNDKEYMDESIQKLFNSSVQPSNTGFTETDAFKHYLCSLKHQIEILNKPSFDEAFTSYEMLLNTAENEIPRLEDNGIFGQTRSFKNFIDVNRAAITRLKKNHGFALKMSWKSM